MIDKVSNFVASIICYIIMPLTPFLFEFSYSAPHEITKRSLMIAVSTYSFTLAFGTKFRMVSIALIATGFLTGGMYGSVAKEENATISCFPACLIYGLITLASLEWIWRHFYEDEVCWFYTIFQKNQRNTTP